MKSSYGGARLGAGRKRGGKNAATITKEQAREALRAVVMEHITELVEAQLSHAKGLKYLVTRDKKSGKFTRVTAAMAANWAEEPDEDAPLVEVWEKDPSVQAFTDLLNRALDKPKEQEQDVNLKGDLVIRWEGDEDPKK